MASFRILGLVSKNEIRSREFSFSSRSLRVEIINLDLVSMPEIGGNFFSVSSRSLRVSVRNSRSRLDERDWIGETLILVSRLKKRLSLTTDVNHIKTRSSWLNCALRDDEAVYWVSIGHYEAVAVGNWWYWVSRGHSCLYILQKVEIWTGVTDAWLTDWQTDNFER